MKIQIVGRLRPFSHQRGAWCPIPWTSIAVQVFPTRLKFLDLTSHPSQEIGEERLQWKGPVEEFTVQLDLETGRVGVSGKTAGGFRRLWMEAIAEGIEITWEKEKTVKILPCQVVKRPAFLERLSLGKHTQLDWSLVTRRMDVEEIAQVLFLLGQQVPASHALSPILHFLQFSDKRTIVHQLKSFVQVGFHGLLAPRLEDDEFQGIIDDDQPHGSPLALLSCGYQALRSLFFDEQEDRLSFLPLLPPEFHAGRMVNLHSSQGDVIHLEWSKKLLRRMVIRPAVSREVFLSFQKPIGSYRLCQKKKHDVKEKLHFKVGQMLFLDRFEK